MRGLVAHGQQQAMLVAPHLVDRLVHVVHDVEAIEDDLPLDARYALEGRVHVRQPHVHCDSLDFRQKRSTSNGDAKNCACRGPIGGNGFSALAARARSTVRFMMPNASRTRKEENRYMSYAAREFHGIIPQLAGRHERVPFIPIDGWIPMCARTQMSGNLVFPRSMCSATIS